MEVSVDDDNYDDNDDDVDDEKKAARDKENHCSRKNTSGKSHEVDVDIWTPGCASHVWRITGRG